MKSKVIFIIVPSYSSNEWLDAKMMQITRSFIDILNIDNQPVYVVDDYNDCNEFLDQCDYLVVSTAGNVIVERDHIYNKINSIPDDVGLLGHILQHGDETPHIHEQFFIINTRAIKSLQLDFDERVVHGLALVRSKEDMHEGHAPLYVELGKKETIMTAKFGTKMMIDCLANGFKVRNFDMDWRYPEVSNEYVGLRLPSRGYCYPKTNTNLFAECLKDLTLRPGLDEAQEIFITAASKVFEFQVLNYWQYDKAPSHLRKKSHIVCTASGFLGELLALGSGATKITFYDINPYNLQFKRHLYANWDGTDYEKFAEDFARDRLLALEPTFGLDKEMAKPLIEETEQKLFPIWKQWREKIEIEYKHIDLIKDIDELLNSIDNDCIIHTSTILGIYPFTAIAHSQQQIDLAKDKIENTGAVWIKS